MKKFLTLFIACVFMFATIIPIACGGQNTVTFEWEQGGDISDLQEWKLYVSETPGGPYDDGQAYLQDPLGNPVDWVVIPYSGTPGATYQADAIIIVPDAATTNLCFVVNAWDTDGNFSGNSNEVCEDFDFLGPGIPYNFKIKVKTRP